MNRKISCAVAIAAAAGAVSFALPGTASAAPAFNCAKVATPSNPNGWGNAVFDEKGQAGKITDGRASDDDGSLEFATSATIKRQASYHSAGQLPLTDLKNTALTFQKSNGNASWQIRITGANTGTSSGFATLVWAAAPTAGKAVATSSNQWWATRQLGNIPATRNASLADLIAAANSDGKKAVVDLYGISSQPGGTADAKVNVDEVTFNGCTTNFKVSGGNGSIEFPSFGS